MDAVVAESSRSVTKMLDNGKWTSEQVLVGATVLRVGACAQLVLGFLPAFIIMYLFALILDIADDARGLERTEEESSIDRTVPVIARGFVLLVAGLRYRRVAASIPLLAIVLAAQVLAMQRSGALDLGPDIASLSASAPWMDETASALVLVGAVVVLEQMARDV